jgi:hypothetical protein
MKHGWRDILKEKVIKKIKEIEKEDAIEPIQLEKVSLLPSEPLYLISAKNIKDAIIMYERRHNKKAGNIYQIKQYFYFDMK